VAWFETRAGFYDLLSVSLGLCQSKTFIKPERFLLHHFKIHHVNSIDLHPEFLKTTHKNPGS